MQQTIICEKCFIGIIGTAWIAGLLMAGSDSAYMPWFNGIGLILFFGASVLLGKRLQALESKTGKTGIPERRQKSNVPGAQPEKRGQRFDPRYALEI